MKSDKSLYLNLEGLRGIAAIAVFFLHASINGIQPPVSLPGSYLAVDLFFVLSGFVIEFAFGGRLEGGMSPGRFILARLIRLYPLYIVGSIAGLLSATIAFFLHAGELNAPGLFAAAVSALFMLPSPTADQTNVVFVLNTPGWSLFFELFVNTLYVVIRPLLTFQVLSGIILVSASLLCYATFSAGHGDVGSAWSEFYGGFPRVCFSFFVGVFLFRVAPAARKPSAYAWIIAVLPIIVFAIPASGVARPILDIFFVMLVFPAIIYFAVAHEPLGLKAKLFRLLGLISYPLYVIHYPILEMTRRALRLFGADPVHQSALLSFGLAVGIALLSWFLVVVYDQPLRRLVSAKLLSSRTKSQSAQL
ncbi:acyltransferase [Belnapia sp. T18]|uniref:Acyltransferase n=1 Tax=Belnapia arida TaxID=2804533 RepID=A0ABS1U7P4_9PROT|nr:acyltransferase [Belnapia arida]MBL6080693.1 acyltransferase [Belnapia arida]